MIADVAEHTVWNPLKNKLLSMVNQRFQSSISRGRSFACLHGVIPTFWVNSVENWKEGAYTGRSDLQHSVTCIIIISILTMLRAVHHTVLFVL